MSSSHEVNLIRVPTTEVEKIWQSVLPYVKKAEPYGFGDWDAEEIRRETIAGNYQLWVSMEGDELLGVTCTSLTENATGMTCFVIFTAGKRGTFKRWADGRFEIEEWAKRNGCTQMEFYGREGWPERLPDYEVVPLIIMRKKL